MQFQGNLMNQTWDNGKKSTFGSDFGPFGPNSGRLRQSLDIMVSYHYGQYKKKSNQLTGFYMMVTLAFNELSQLLDSFMYDVEKWSNMF